MVTNLRDAKSRFSELVKLAAEGEEILITVRGEPMVKLTRAAVGASSDDRDAWVDELTESAAREQSGNAVATTQAYWDESRKDR
jgi:prevent-host-death family protein